ncbi:MAG: nucleotidyltransferase family protein [Oscillospiraceae bacterium]|nr:nucleotidyltransferase family protein [Oscillospiraceae bacterium]
MTSSIQAAIALIKSAITGEAVSLPEKYSMERTQRLLQEQGLLPIGFVGAGNCGYPADSEIMLFLLDYYCMATVHSEQQLELIEKISQAFEKNGIDYMPVKGAILKTMYPSHELRGMSDADILIREEEYPRIRPVMEKLGFRESGESDHEHIWLHKYLKVELHKRLIPSYNKDFYSFFGEGWDLAKIQNGHRWAMTEEDAFIYNFIHFAKHYRDGEGSSRFVIDLWVHMGKCPQLDMVYIREKMAELRIERFYDHIMAVIDAWFRDGQWSEVTERITQVLFNIDATERKQANAVAQSLHITHDAGDDKKAQKIQKLHAIFPSRDHMNWSYPRWKKVPLPIAWVLRWLYLVFFRRKAIQRKKEQVQVTAQQRENYRKDLEYVGLEFSDGVALPD